MHRYRGGAWLAGNAEQIGDLERRPGHGTDDERDVDLVVERKSAAVLDPDLEHRELTPAFDRIGSHLVVGMADRAEELDPGLFEIGQIGRVVDDTHGVGLGKARPQPMDERIVGRITRRLQRLPQGSSPPSPVQRLPGAVRRTTAVSSWPCDSPRRD